MRLKANGIEMNYELSGKKGGPVVVLSHSLGSSLVNWNLQMDVLEPHFRVLRYDTRGHGGTEAPPGPYTLDLLARDLTGLLDALKFDKVHFVGLSMGGMIGQCLALHHRPLLRSLVLCDTAAVVPAEAQPVWQERIDLARRQGVQALLDQTMERWFTSEFLKRNPPILSIIKKQFLATPLEGYVGCGEAIRKLNTIDRLSEISLPTLIIVGEDDPATPVAGSKAIHERIAHSRLVILPSTRHLGNVERAGEFNAALLGFLREQ